ncbi:uncharacterized protein ASPGLDRAFT_1055385 [Aspergillus glaucus CBS 516.65]|uniref:Transcription factor domain-containing protein n=1 Tax=Aspergillus glaucus CBS 516.65 TaxID=1160497 RepID=A0A1L9V5U8_ASPGL|nr:hypothetical protein ASPGLDRAFT_1055385 [Aspergillus glaucus CBS 516.65]OJJ79305.1 hypothetical protein ASPGLDRAFT_1055385 [Aspergillus glaucus CBS 516.65]
MSGQQDTSYHSLGPAFPQTHLPQGERSKGGVSPETQRDALLSSNGLDAIDIRGLEIPTTLHDSPSPNLAAIFSHAEKPPSFAPSVESPIRVTLGLTGSTGDGGRRNSEDRSIALLVQEQIELSAAEVTIFRNYVERVSRWIDSFSRDQPFYRKVPIMALRCPVLMNSCLALSMKQSTLKASGDEQRIRENAAIHYHQKAIKALSTLLADTECASRDEILASSIILSTYEMFDVVGESFGSHLGGVAFFLQSRRVYGNQCGLQGAVYWTWYRHEIWAALQTGRQMLLDEAYWQPPLIKTFEGVCVEDIANRVIFIFGQCVSFCNSGDTGEASADEKIAARQRRVTTLDAALEDWKRKLPSSMSHFFAEPTASQQENASHQFPFLWFMYPQSAIAYQVYHASKILLNLHRPPIPAESRGLGHTQSLWTRRQIERSREQIFLVSNAGVPDTWSLVSTQCLYIAGLVTEGVLERQRTLELIEDCQKSSGRRTMCLADELRTLWAQ